MAKNGFKYSDSNTDIGCGGLLLALVIALVVVLIGPALAYFGGWITGSVCQHFFGDVMVNGINTVFGTQFAVENLPTMFGTLGMIGSFFHKTSATTKAFRNN